MISCGQNRKCWKIRYSPILVRGIPNGLHIRIAIVKSLILAFHPLILMISPSSTFGKSGFTKFLIPRNYCAKLRVIYYEMFNDLNEIQESEDQKFVDSNLDLEKAEEKLNSILRPLINRDFDRIEDSIHWLIFSALSLKDDSSSILEIGTHDGTFTKILSELYPSGNITTIELPNNDPLFLKLYGRESTEALRQFLATQNENVRPDNVRLLNVNSFFLLDKANQKFDLIWIDGGHLYPEVAWDICNAYYLCKEGGMILCDDVIPLRKTLGNKYVSSQSYEVFEYLAQRLPETATFFLKRLSSNWNCYAMKKRYVACLRR